jgi:hypothetical protein
MLTMSVRVDPEMHRCLVEALWYLENRAELIDPDMFDVKVEKVQELQRMFNAELDPEGDREPPDEVSLTFEELWTLDYYLIAAEEYSARSTETGLLTMDDEEWEHVREWIARARKLFRPH